MAVSRTNKVPALPHEVPILEEKPGNKYDKEARCSLDDSELSGER